MSTFLANLPKITTKRKKRVGRGSGSSRGAKSGRGTTRHQKARENIPLHFEGGQARMVKRYPLLRGKGKNKSVSKKPYLVALSRLNVLKDEVVNIETLITHKLIDSAARTRGVKIVASKKKLEKKLKIQVPISKGAGQEVVKLGGTVEE